MSLKNREILVEVQKNGRITIPKTARKLYDIQDGDYITLLIIEKQRKLDSGRDLEEYPVVFLDREEWLEHVGKKEKNN